MTDSYCDVSVIIPAYRAAGTIGRTLESVARQTLKPREVIVVDDGSDDGTADAAWKMADRLGGIQLSVITQPNQGAGSARNRALAEATQPYVAFIDADDEWLPQKLARSMPPVLDNDLTLLAHDYLDATPTGDVHCDCRSRFVAPPDPWLQLYRKGYIPSCSVVARLDAVLAAGGFDESLRNAQDFDLWLTMLAGSGSRFDVLGEPLLRYHHTPGGIMSFTERRLRCCEAIAVRHLDGVRARGGRPLAELAYRMAAIHLEAIRAYRSAGRPGRALKTALLAPLRLGRAALNGLLGNSAPRSGLNGERETTPAEPLGGGALETALVLGCGAAAVVGYLLQFQGILPALLRKVGFGA